MIKHTVTQSAIQPTSKSPLKFSKTFYLIFRFAKPHWRKFFILLFCVLTTSFFGASYPFIFGKLVDEVFYGKNMEKFLQIVLIYGALFLLSQGLHFCLNMSWASLMTRFLFDVRRAIFNQVLSLSGKQLSNLRTGDLLSRMNEDTEQFMNLIHWNIFYTLGALINTLISMGFVFFLNWKLGLVSLVLVPMVVFVSKHFSQKAKAIHKEKSKENGLIAAWIYEMLKGLTDSKLLCAGDRVLNLLLKRSISVYRMKVSVTRIQVLSERISAACTLLGTLCVYGLSAFFIARGDLTVGGFIACADYFKRLSGGVSNLSGKALAIAENMAGIERVQAVLEEAGEVDVEQAPSLSLQRGEIRFSQVVFSYSQDFPVLRDISFHIQSGERIALVGRSGAGKSTIANLLIRLYEPLSGCICLDGQDIAACSRKSLRAQVGIVHQETILFEGTLRYNLIFSDDKSQDGRIEEALKGAHLWDFVDALPKGLDTPAIGLSGGQKQRLAIAQIFLKNPKILIFDEATSALDREAEQVIQASWELLCRGRTIVIIAHRLSTILNADKILMLDEGRIQGFDTHERLIKHSAAYQLLFSEQYEEHKASQKAVTANV